MGIWDKCDHVCVSGQYSPQGIFTLVVVDNLGDKMISLALSVGPFPQPASYLSNSPTKGVGMVGKDKYDTWAPHSFLNT